MVTAVPEELVITEVTGMSAPVLSLRLAGRVAIASAAPTAEVVAVKLPVGATKTGLTGSAGVVAEVGSLTLPELSVAVIFNGALGPTVPERVTV